MTAEKSCDPWATLDELLGIEVAGAIEGDTWLAAFYGRCSTEDNQEPRTSRAWQFGNAQKFVGPLGATIVAEHFDIGQSRSVPWERRTEAARLLAELKNPQRGWNAVVVGEGTRCWFGNQFSLTAPRFDAYGVELWVPELGGRFDTRNPSHKMLMSVLGGMSESERQHVQARVRAAMDAQVLNEGRHQGGRTPYGYRVIDGGPHPNPSKAAEGRRLRILVLDDVAAEVVRRIFAEYLDGRGDRAIANGLNRDGIPYPSAMRPHQNRHRLADGWQGSTVRAILENPRYTGYAFFGRWTRQETLLDPDDVAAGNIVRFRRSAPDRVVRSRRPAHPAIVTVEDFTDVQLRRRARAAGGLAASRKLERGPKATKRVYVFRGRVRCGYCERRMEGTPRGNRIYYRCSARSLVPGSPVLRTHPKNVYLPEVAVLEYVNEWIGDLFSPAHIDETVALLLASQDGDQQGEYDRDGTERKLAEAEAAIQRFQAAIKAGVDPNALVDAINRAQAERNVARVTLDNLSTAQGLTRADIYAMVDYLCGEVGRHLNRADPAKLETLYESLRLDMRYDVPERAVDVSIRPGRGSARVRGGT